MKKTILFTFAALMMTTFIACENDNSPKFDATTPAQAQTSKEALMNHVKTLPSGDMDLIMIGLSSMAEKFKTPGEFETSINGKSFDKISKEAKDLGKSKRAMMGKEVSDLLGK